MTDGAETASAALAAALADAGLDVEVEAHGRLAVLLARGDVPALADPAVRQRATVIAAAHGFSHVALDLSPAEDDAR